MVFGSEKLSRRGMLSGLGLAGAAAVGTGMLGVGQRTASAAGASFTQVVKGKQKKVGVVDVDLVALALNLEYFEAEFYLWAAYGTGLTNDDVTGTGTLGEVAGAAQVPWTTDYLRKYAEEAASNELGHVRALRGALPIKGRVARPTINFGTSMTYAAKAAGLISGDQTFNAFESEDNFLLASFLIEDFGVTAYKGVIPYIQRQDYQDAATAIVACESYHAGIIRTTLMYRGIDAPELIAAANAISAARNALDGATDDDLGLTDADGNPTMIPANASGFCYGRTINQVLAVAYLGASPTDNSFFPDGLNGRIA